MSDTPNLTVPGYNQYGHYDRPATRDEVIAWLREHDAINYEAALDALDRLLDKGAVNSPEHMRVIVDAALSGEDQS